MTYKTAAAVLAFALSISAMHAEAAGTPIGDPYYAYFLHEYREVNPTPGVFNTIKSLGRSGEQHGGVLLQTHDLGGSALGFPAADMVSGYNDGKTFWSQTVSPIRGGANRDLVGGMSEIFIAQSFRKNTAAATLDFSFTAGRLQLMEYGSGRGDGYALDAGARFTINVINHDTGLQTFTESQFVRLYEHFGSEAGPSDNTFQFTVTQEDGPLTRGLAPWSWKCDECGQGAYGFAVADLLAPYGGPISMDFIAVGADFTVSFYLMTYAIDERQGETSALAYAKDPVTDGLGIGFEFTDLTPTNQPIVTSIPEPQTWALLCLGIAVVLVRSKLRASARTLRIPSASPS